MSTGSARIALTVACLAALAGCTSAARIDASTGEKLAQSLDRYVRSANKANHDARAHAAALLKATYLEGTSLRAELAENVPPLDILNRARFEDVLTIAGRVERWSRDGMHPAAPHRTPETVTERYWRNAYIAGQLGAQIALLEQEREVARYKDLFTVDQFKYSNSAYIPPQDGVPLGKDVATFTTTFHNTAVFNVYSVGFHVSVKDPTQLAPVVDEVLTYDAKDAPIQVGEYRQIQLTCCDSYRNETTNLALRQLPMNATISMELTAASDYTKKNRLQGVGFTSEDNLKLLASRACKADLDAHLRDWTPATAVEPCRHY